MRLMFSSKVEVFAFQDALIRNGLFFDGSFNNLVVVTSLESVLRILFEEINRVKCPNGIGKGGFLKYLLNREGVENLDESVREQVRALKKEQAELALAEMPGKLAAALVSGLTPRGICGLGEFLVAGLSSISKLFETEGTEEPGSLGFIKVVASCLSAYKPKDDE